MLRATGANWRIAGLSAWMLALAGCGDLPTVEEVKQTVTENVPSAPAIIDNGKIELTVGPAINAASCYFRTAAFSAGRPTVVQFTSYKDPKSESFPSIMVRATLPVGAASPTVGQTLQAQVYIQEKANGPVMHAALENPVEISVTAADGKVVDAKITGGSVRNTETGASTTIGGTLHAVAL